MDRTKEKLVQALQFAYDAFARDGHKPSFVASNCASCFAMHVIEEAFAESALSRSALPVSVRGLTTIE